MPAVTNTAPSTMTPSATTSTSPQKKFNTISANPTTGNGVGLTARASIKGLFESSRGSSQVVSKDDADATAMLATTSSTSARLPKLGADAAASVAREDGPWSVSVAALPLTTTEKRDLLRKKSRQSGVQQYTLYVTTPTHNLTLTRSAVELLELDNRLREGRPDATTTLPKLPNLPQPSATGITTSRSKFLQTISRTLSPSGHKNRAAANSNQLGAAGTALMETKNADNVPLSGSNTALTSSATSKASPMGSTPTVSAPISPTSEEPPNLGNSKEHSVTTNLATYLTTAANLAFVKRHKAWKRFINVGSDDLQSVRVERRIRKIRSDLAKHVKSAVAPANVNVAATPSHSDIGEEGGRTDDDRSFSGRSTSHSFRNDRQDLSGRSASSDNDKAARDETRKSKSFAGIPEESERQASLEGQGDVAGGDAASSSRSPTAKDKVAKRERRHRRRTDEKVTVDDFDMIRVLGKGCAGKVLLVRHKPTKGLFAMKSIHKRHVLAHQELQHTLTEQAVLKRMAKEVMDPFVVKLWWSFHDVNNLYLVMDFHPGGDLATQLSRWGRLGRDRARFYAAEIVEGVEGLHRAGVIYRDLKPENVLIGVDGHIVLSDFGLSKEFPVRNIGDISNGGSSTPPPTSQGTGGGGGGIKGGRGSHWMSASDDARSTGSPNSSTDAFSTSGRSKSRWADERDVTTTFCGTAEYLAPEVIQGSAYSYEVDWWSFGTMLYEMLTGITPFWADTHADMYVRVLHDDLVFPDDRVLDQDTKSILRGLLQRNPMLRMKEPRIKKHPYFSMIEWDHVFHKRYIPPYIPPINPLDETDTQNFDETFLDMKPVVNGGDDEDEEEGSEDAVAVSSTDKDVTSNNKAGNAKDTADVSALISRSASDGKSLFDGYSFRGRKDSGSIRSSIFSSEPSEHPQTEGGKGTDSGGARQRAESDDDNAAALAAVAALDHLEREAAASEAALSSPSQMSNSTRPTSVKGSDDLVKSTPDTPTKSTNKGGGGATIGLLARPSSTAGQPATIAEAEREDEDDEWDMVDAPAADESYPTEANGGKGQNLFARGVVDTYRLLRRQESSRLPLGASYSGRTLNRLSRRQQSSPRDRSKVARESGGGSGQQTNGTANRSVASLGSRSGNEATPQALVDDESSMSFAHTTMNSNPSLSGIASNLTPLEETRRKGASPSLASSDEQTSNEKLVNKQRIKKMKRFTNFFETSR